MSTLAPEMLTYGDIVTFIMLNRGTEAFKGVDQQKIEEDVWEAMQTGNYLYETDKQGRLTGYLQYQVWDGPKVIFIYQNLALSLDRLYRFFQTFLGRYPGYQLRAMRHGHPVCYNTDKLNNKLKHYGWKRTTIW